MSQKADTATGFDLLVRERAARLLVRMRRLGCLVEPTVMKRLTSGEWTDAHIHRTITVQTRDIAYYQDVRDWNHDRLIAYDEERGVDSRHFVLANAGKTLGGDWDLARIPFEESDTYRLLHEHFVDGVEWDQTEVFRRFERDVMCGKKRWNKSRNRRELLQSARRCDRLFERISSQGYQPSGRQGLSPFADEITVSIGRNGELLFNNVGGRHRLSIAKILGIQYVPVRVLLRHSIWQAVRDELRRAPSLKQLAPSIRRQLANPDLADLVPLSWVLDAAEPDEATVRAAA